jgi:DNA polymerase-3 subunit delta
MAKSKTGSVTAAVAALDYLARPEKYPVRPVCVVFGDEPFLKSEVLAALRAATLSEDEAEFSFRTFAGDEAEPRSVFDELATVALFGGGKRLVLVTEADDFVSAHRPLLEDYVAKPRETGVLVLDVKSWPSNTRLFKQLADVGLQIDCKAPADRDLVEWLRSRAERAYHATFARGAAERLVEIVGPQMGRLDQETSKLSLLASQPSLTGPEVGSRKSEAGRQQGAGIRLPTSDLRPPSVQPPAGSGGANAPITIELIEDAVGGWRAKTAWEMIDSAAAGDVREALVQLDRLILAGESPVALMGQIAWRFRQLAAAARITVQAQAAGQRVNLRHALEQVGVKTWQGAMDKAEANLRQLGAHRAAKLYRWLLEADLALKGASSSGDRARLVLEQLFVRMSRHLAPAPGGNRTEATSARVR